ncbi:MAG: protein kinase [Pseudomonadota bacterium]|nr:protein kinase [Pseudomonadota bacterium]
MSSSTIPGLDFAERIGEGGIADVFRGTWHGRSVALKVLREPDRAGLRKRFVREGRLLQRLVHPGLVRCLAVIEGPQPVLVLELLEGASLDVRLLREGPISPDEAVLFASSALRTLGYLHEQGIVHRDIKASNVWLGDDRRVVLVDLGLAADTSDPLTTTLGDVLGTHAYMAPEQIAGAETDHRCDLYSLGITLYEAVCGERPYQATGLAGYLQAHRAAGAAPIVERVPDIPVRLASLIDRLMARDPAARPASAVIALAQLTGSRGINYQLGTPRMVGREAATGAIQAVLDGGGVLRVTGELGSGIGVVARHAVALAREVHVEYAAVRCRARTGPDDVIAILARELSAIAGPVVTGLEGVLDALRTLVAQDGRFLVVVEDLDVAPEGAAEVLDEVARVAGVGMVITGRSLSPRPEGRGVVLRPLTLAEVRDQIGSMLGTPTVPPGLDIGIMRTTGGLPAIVTAVLREQVDRGAVWCDGMGEDGRPRWCWDPSARMLPGEDTTRLFARALARLPEATRSLVQTLAVAGEPVPLDLLLTAAGADPSGAELGPALRSGLCEVTLRGGEEWVALRRAVLEPILLHGLDEDAERGLHLVLADAARQRSIREWEQRFLLLHLARGARDPQETGRLVDLGDWLVGSGRPFPGLEVLDAATRLPIDDGPVLARLALARCDALCALGRLPEARSALEAGRTLALAADDLALVERARVAQLELTLNIGTHLPVEAYTSLVDPPASASARTLLVAGQVHVALGQLDRAADLFHRAIDRTAPGPVDRVGVAARLGNARLVALLGDPQRAMTLYRVLAAELRAVDRPLAGCEALVRLAELQRCQGRLAGAMESLRAALELVGERNTAWSAAIVGIGRARVHLTVGDTEGAEALLVANAASGEAAAPWPVRSEYLATLASLRAAMGDTPAALAVHLRAVEGAAIMPDRIVHAFHSGMVGILTVDSAAVVEAVDALATIPGLQARLLLMGGRTGRDAEVLTAAEAEARAAGDQMLLLEILYARRHAADRAEARAILTASLDGLFGPFRERFSDSPWARWALGGAPRP